MDRYLGDLKIRLADLTKISQESSTFGAHTGNWVPWMTVHTLQGTSQMFCPDGISTLPTTVLEDAVRVKKKVGLPNLSISCATADAMELAFITCRGRVCSKQKMRGCRACWSPYNTPVGNETPTSWM